MSNPFARWHHTPSTGTASSTSGSSEHLPPLPSTPSPSFPFTSGHPPMSDRDRDAKHAKRETVYLTPQQVREQMSEEERAWVMPWPEPEPAVLPRKPKGTGGGMQWTGTVGYSAPSGAGLGLERTGLWDLASSPSSTSLDQRQPPPFEREHSRTSSMDGPRALPRIQTHLLHPALHPSLPPPVPPKGHSQTLSTTSLHSSKPSTSSAYSAMSNTDNPIMPANPSTSVRSTRSRTKPSLASVFRGSNRAPSPPPPISPRQTTGFSLAPRPGNSSSFAGSDISVSPSVATTQSQTTPTATSSRRSRRPTQASSDDPFFSPQTPGSTRSSGRSSATPQTPGDGSQKGMFGRLKQKMSTTSLRPGRAVPNGGDPVPPLPVRRDGVGRDNSLPTSMGQKTPTNISFSSSSNGVHKPRGSVPLPSLPRLGMPLLGNNKRGKQRSEPTLPASPEEEDDPEFKTKTYFDNVDFDNLNPEEFLSFGAVGGEDGGEEEGEGRSSGETFAGTEGTGVHPEEGQGRPSIATESSAGVNGDRRPSLLRASTQLDEDGEEEEDGEWEVPDSWAVMTEEALAREEGLESEPEESEREEAGAEGDDAEGIEHVEDEALYADGREDWMDTVEDKYVLRVYRPNGTWHVVECPLTATASEIRQRIVQRFGLENEGMTGRYRFFIVEKGQERMLMKKEKPLVILRRRLLTAGYTKRDKLKAQGGRELQYICRFVLQTSDLHGLDEGYDGMFDNLGGIVNLTDLNLQTIPTELHKIAIHLVELRLRRNPIIDLPKDFCMATTQLRVLDLSRTALKRIPAAISFCRSLQELDVSYNRIRSADTVYGGLENLKHLKKLYMSANIISDLPLALKDLPLTELRLDMNRLEHVPEVVSKLQLLEILNLSHNDLKSLPQSLGNLTRLACLFLPGNSLETLPKEMRYLSCLQALDISRNRIQDISVVSALLSLRHFRASYNQIENVTNTFHGRLKHIDLHSNPVTRFHPLVKPLKDRVSLRYLNLSNTNLGSLQLELDVFPELCVVHLDDSHIGELPPSVTKLKRLERLSACNASLKHLPDALGDMPELKELLVYGNDLTAIPETIWMCRALKTLNASSNKLRAFPDPPSGGGAPLVSSLTALFLADNIFNDSVFLPIVALEELCVLNVSQNPLRCIPDNTLVHMNKLEALSLSSTNLVAIQDGMLPQSGSLKRLYLNTNRLFQLPSTLQKNDNLMVLDVGHNNLSYDIHSFSYSYQWIWNTRLRMLNLSGNKFLVISKPQHDSRERKRVNAADFRVLPDLVSLGLMDVTLTENYLPAESDQTRIRTSGSLLNGMRYDVSEAIDEGAIGSFDMAVPNYRGRDDECLFGIFTRTMPLPLENGEKENFGDHLNSLVRFLTRNFPAELEKELVRMEKLPELGDISDALRRTFLALNKTFYDSVVNPSGLDNPIPLSSRAGSGDAAARHPSLRLGASACVAYRRGKALHIANVGNVEAFVGYQGEKHETVTTLHTPWEKEEKDRIRTAESRVTPRGILKGNLPVSRAFGFYAGFPVINACPSIKVIQLSPDHQYLVIANPEFWRYVKRDTAQAVVQKHHEPYDGLTAAQELRDLALAHGASGNVQVMVVMLSDLFMTPTQLERARQHGGSLFPQPKTNQDDAPIGDVVLVFTDIRNSTSLWEQIKEPMGASLDMHNKCMRRWMRLCGGYEVKTEGDAFVISFSSLPAAVRCCLGVQLQLLREDWPIELLSLPDGKEEFDQEGNLIERGLSVRMGIHFGRPYCRRDPVTNRMDYFGPVVNRTARVSSAAKGGQIMLSAEVLKRIKEMLSGQPGGDADRTMLSAFDRQQLEQIKELQPRFIEIGPTDLKGFEQKEWLTLLFPRTLTGRLLLSKSQSADAQGGPDAGVRPDTDPYGLGVSRETLMSLALVCRRLEALDAGRVFRPYGTTILPGGEQPGIIQGSKDELLGRLGYTGSIQVDEVLEALVLRIEHYVTRLRLRNAFNHPEVRQIMRDIGGFEAKELLHLFRDATAQTRMSEVK